MSAKEVPHVRKWMKSPYSIGLGYLIGWCTVDWLMHRQIRWEGLVGGVSGGVVILFLRLVYQSK